MLYPFLGRDYQLEKQGDEGNFVDMEATLESTGVPFVFNLSGRVEVTNIFMIIIIIISFVVVFHSHLYIYKSFLNSD